MGTEGRSSLVDHTSCHSNDCRGLAQWRQGRRYYAKQEYTLENTATATRISGNYWVEDSYDLTYSNAVVNSFVDMIKATPFECADPTAATSVFRDQVQLQDIKAYLLSRRLWCQMCPERSQTYWFWVSKDTDLQPQEWASPIAFFVPLIAILVTIPTLKLPQTPPWKWPLIHWKVPGDFWIVR